MTADRHCNRCHGPAVAPGVWCAPCRDWFNSDHGRQQYAQWDRITHDPSLMREWSIATFPATDTAGKAALEAVKPWLWTHTGHHYLDGVFTPIDEELDADTYDDDHPIWEWHHGDHYGLNAYLHGPVGSGKTGLAWALLRARVWLKYDYEDDNRGEWPAFANVVELLDKAKAAMSAGDPASPIRNLYDASILVLDDLGAERPTDWARDAIAALVQHRHTRDLPTIITSNYAPSALAKRLGHDDPMIGQRIVSRLTEHCIKHKLDRADLRLRDAA